MRLAQCLFVIVLAMCGLIAVVLWIPEADGGHGMEHPNFATMKRGGDGPEPLVLWLGWGWGVLQILLIVGLMGLGARKGEDCRGLWMPLFVGGAAFVGLWTYLVLTYVDYVSDPDPAMLLGFPLPSALVLYGIWALPAIFAVYFVLGFKRWVLTDADLAEFEAMMAKKEASISAGSPEPGGGSS